MWSSGNHGRSPSLIVTRKTIIKTYVSELHSLTYFMAFYHTYKASLGLHNGLPTRYTSFHSFLKKAIFFCIVVGHSTLILFNDLLTFVLRHALFWNAPLSTMSNVSNLLCRTKRANAACYTPVGA